MTAAAAGENWALLPYTAGFIDALHSTGIAQTLCAIERLAVLFTEHWGRPTLAGRLKQYEETVFAEIALIDQLVSGCYLTRHDFRRFAAFAMLYFAAATTYERRRAEGRIRPGAAFLCADDPQWRSLVSGVFHRARQERGGDDQGSNRFEQFVAEAIAPYNIAGLCDPRMQNMYRHTAADKGD
jgi:FADH2 O2-dependent halogenase